MVNAGKGSDAAVGVDMTLFGMRRQVYSAKIKLNLWKFSKISILSIFRKFSLLRMNVLLILRYIN